MKRLKSLATTLSLLAITLTLLVAGGTAVNAQSPEAYATSPEVTQGALRVIPAEGEAGDSILEFPLQHTDVQAEIAGMVAEVTVTQTFANPFDETIEAIYVFPLPDEAAVNDMTMHIGDRTIRGLIKKREEARQIYEQAREAGQTASLLEQERPNIFTQSVANITPGAEIRIEIHYVETLAYDDGTYEFTFPMVVGPRFIPGEATGRTGGGWAPDTTQVPDASRITPPVLKPEQRTGHDIAVAVSLDAGVPIQDMRCRSHEVEMTRDGKRRATVALKPFDTIPNKDFMLAWDVAGEKPEMALLTHREGDSGGYFTLMIQPKAEFEAAEITPKEMIFVVDCSGSMRGEPMAKAKQAMRKCIMQMNPGDSFRVIKFSNSASELSSEPMTYSTDNIKRALAYIEGMSGSGGTQMIEGIKVALDYPEDPERVRIVSFMTDGYIGNETQILAAIDEKLGSARLFSFGVGSSVNRYLLDRMAEVGRGVAQYVRPNEDAAQFVERFYERIDKPYLLDIDIDWGGLQVADIYPNPIPDLFASQPVVLKGRYTEPGSGEITVRGRLAGELWSQKLAVELPRQRPENEGLGSIWARARIKDLMDRMYGGPDPDLVAQVTNLALEFRLMSAYTSFVAVEEKVVNEGGELRTIQQPVPMPEGVSYEGVFGDATKAARMALDMLATGTFRGAPMGAAGAAGPAGPAQPPGVMAPGRDAAGRPAAGAVGPKHVGKFAEMTPSMCLGEADDAIIAAGQFAAQEPVSADRLAFAASAASPHADLPLGLVYGEPIAVADLGALPEGLALNALYLSGGSRVAVSTDEAQALRDFIEGGGFLIIDGAQAFRAAVRDLLHIEEWDVEIRSIPEDHPLFGADRVGYDIDRPAIRGIYRGGALVGVISDVALGAGWTNRTDAELTPEWMHGVNLMVFVAGR